MRTLIIISLIALSLSGNAATIKSYLLNNKFTRAGAAGVMGNLYAESGLNPRVYERSKHKRIGLSDEDLNCQLKYLVKELSGYRKLYSILTSTKDVNTACDRVLLEFERPANAKGKINQRRSYCRNYY